MMDDSSEPHNGADPKTSGESSQKLGLPLRCTMDLDRKMFRVVHERGKTLASGGFGVSIRCSENSNQSSLFLFLEEALYLFERGMMECVDGSGCKMDSRALYSLMNSDESNTDWGVTLPVYLAYAHLRAQTFRVLRHDPKRRRPGGTTATKQSSEEESGETPADAEQMEEESDPSLEVEWDAYWPNAQFARTRPGVPDFHVTVAYYARPYSMSRLQRLVGDCSPVPLKVATVSDSGTVILFGVTHQGVPDISADDEQQDATNCVSQATETVPTEPSKLS